MASTPSPFSIPFGVPPASTTGPNPMPTIPVSAQHGSAEQWAGTVFANSNNPMGITPPSSPRRTARSIPRSPSPRRRTRDDDDDDNRDREREPRRRNDTPFFNAEYDAPEGLGARLLVAENRIRELTATVEMTKTTFIETKNAIEQVSIRADSKIEEMRNFVVGVEARFAGLETLATNVEGRFTQIETSFPERFHGIESRQTQFVATINALTGHIQEKFKEFEEALKSRPAASAAVPPVPPSFGGPNLDGSKPKPTNNEFFIGSPLSAPSGQSDSSAPDPWANFAKSGTSYATGGLPRSAAGGLPQQNPAPAPAPNFGGFAAAPTPQPNFGFAANPNLPPGMAPPQATHRPWDSRLWATNEKVSKELKPFDGTHGRYKIWSSRLKDHFIERNSDWQYVFTEIESHKFPILKENLRMGFLNAGQYTFDIDFGWVATTPWTFIGKHVIDTVYNNRNVLAGGHNNGLELWRALFIKHEGGADQVELGGMGSLHNFPKCEKAEQLQFWVGKWQEVKDMYGAGISDAHLKSMFLNILPDSVNKDLREKPQLISLQQCIDHVLADIGRLNDVQLSKMHMDRLKQSLGSTQRISQVLEQTERSEDTPKADDPFKLLLNALSDKMDKMGNIVAAVARPKARATPGRDKRGPSQFAQFGDKCLHCGSGDHRARECPVKKSLLAKNGGKFPAGYKSAFDKWKEKQPKPVAPFIDLEDEDDAEFDETNLDVAPVWCLPQCALRCQECEDPPSFVHSNAFSELFDADNYNDDDDEEAQILDAIKQLSSKITVGPKLSQEQRKSQRASLQKCTVAQIAKLVRDGKLDLPNLDLDGDADYEAVWALVDSGAARSCARRQIHFGHTATHLTPSSVRMATASGEELKSRGCFRLEAVTAEGNAVVQTFEDTDVDMPIMSVGELSSNGELGSTVLFGENDGHVIDLKTSATSKFHRRRGVYFMKIYVLRNKAVNPDFTRPGTA